MLTCAEDRAPPWLATPPRSAHPDQCLAGECHNAMVASWQGISCGLGRPPCGVWYGTVPVCVKACFDLGLFKGGVSIVCGKGVWAAEFLRGCFSGAESLKIKAPAADKYRIAFAEMGVPSVFRNL